MNYAGFWRRFAASLIDGLILSIPGFLLGGAIKVLAVGIGINFILSLFYFPFFESSTMQATPGKALMSLAVTSEQGNRLSFKAALIRFLGRYLSMIVLYIGYIMQLFTEKRQTLHDVLSESVVVNRPPADVNYFTVWKQQLKDVIDRL